MLKKHFIVLILAVFCTCCSRSNEDQHQLNNFLVSNQSESTFHLIHGTDMDLLGTNGTKIYIPRECFIKKDGGDIDPKDTIMLLLKDVLKPSEIIFEGLNTMANDGRLLETSGMIKLIAMHGEDTLIINPDKYFKVAFNNVFKGEANEVNLFSGNNSENGFFWSVLPRERLGNTLLIKETIIKIKRNEDIIGLTRSLVTGIDTLSLDDKQKFNHKILDTVWVTEYRWINLNSTSDEDMPLNYDSILSISQLGNPYLDTGSIDEAAIDEYKMPYVFNLQELDWINLDYFLYAGDTSATLTISKLPGQNFRKYLVFEDINSVYSINNNESFIKGLPTGKKCKLLVFGCNGSELQYDLISLKTGSNTNAKIRLKNTNEAELTKIIKSLD